MNKSQQKISAWQKSIGKTLKGLGAILGGIAAGKIAKDFVTTAMRTEVLDVAMRSVAKSSGYAIQALQEHRKAVMEMGIAEQEATQILTRFMQAQLDTAYAAKVARVAQDAAVIANMNSSEAAEQMTEAIAKLRPELLSAFGFTRNLNDIYSDYAKTVGKTVKQLSETEKKQAMLNYILKEGEKIAGTYEASMGVVGKQISSLPRYWQTLQNAIATPLTLPGLSVAVEGITNALKSAISWAEANKAVLQHWGQSIANVVRAVVKGFSLVTGAIVQNWQTLKFAGTTLLSYIVITKGVAAATTAWRIATLTLKGELMTKIPVLTAVSAAIGTYRLQMALAPAATNIFTAALLRLRAALYAVHTALGPIGWAILGVSAVVTGGIMLWSKYAASVEKANLERVLQAVSGQEAKLADAGQQVAQSGGEAADALKDQSEATKKAGKEAGKNIQSFDEVHQIMEDTAGAAEDITAGLDQVTMPTLEAPGAMALPGLDTSALEQAKPTLTGFWDWIKQGFANAWDSIKNAVVGAWNWIVAKTRPVWEPVANFFKSLWDGIKSVAIAAWDGIGNVLSTVWQAIINIGTGLWQVFASALGQIWNALQVAAQTIWGAIKDYVIGTWNNIWLTASTIWNAVKTFLSTVWNNTLLLASTIWQAIRDLILGKIDLRTAVSTIWGAIQGFLSGNWNALKTLATTVWTAVAQFITIQWNLISELTTTIWTAIATFLTETWNTIREAAFQAWEIIKINLLAVWEALKGAALTTWEAIKTAILTPVNIIKGELDKAWAWIKEKAITIWDSIKTAAQEKWNGVRDVIKGAINGIIGMINKFIRAFNRIEIRVPSISIPFVGTVGGWTVRVPQIPEIPMLAKGGLVTDPTLAMLGEAGPEAVIPLGRSGFAGDLADTVAQAVYQAIMDAIRIAQASSQQSDDRELVLKIDNTVLARMQLPAIIREGQRQGLNLVVRPQGV